ncbi:uncharacterized protein ACMZJ9_012344 [Mantella aurantiaca]
MARNEEKQLGRLNRLWLQRERDEGRVKQISRNRPKLGALHSATDVKKWIPSIKHEIEYYLEQSQLSHYSERKIEEFQGKIEALKKEYQSFLWKLRRLDPSCKEHPWKPRGYTRKRSTQIRVPAWVETDETTGGKILCTPVLAERAKENHGSDFEEETPQERHDKPPPAPPALTCSGPLPAPPALTCTGPLPAPPALTCTGPLPAPPALTCTGPPPAPPALTCTGPPPAPPALTCTGSPPAPPALTCTGSPPAPPALTCTGSPPATPILTCTGPPPAPPALTYINPPQPPSVRTCINLLPSLPLTNIGLPPAPHAMISVDPPPLPALSGVYPPPLPALSGVYPPPLPALSGVYPPPLPALSGVDPPPLPALSGVDPPPLPALSGVYPPPLPALSGVYPPPLPALSGVDPWAQDAPLVFNNAKSQPRHIWERSAYNTGGETAKKLKYILLSGRPEQNVIIPETKMEVGMEKDTPTSGRSKGILGLDCYSSSDEES